MFQWGILEIEKGDLNMTRQRKTSEFLRTCIFEALMLLLDQKKYEDITISELAEKAGVSRMTYYRTYENKEDVVIQFLRTRTDSLLRQFDEGNYNNRYEWYRDIFEEILEQKDVTYKILKTPSFVRWHWNISTISPKYCCPVYTKSKGTVR